MDEPIPSMDILVLVPYTLVMVYRLITFFIYNIIVFNNLIIVFIIIINWSKKRAQQFY